VLGIEAAQLSCFDVGKGLKLEEDLIKPNPTHWSVHWLKLSQARGIATVLMYGERRRCTDIPKGYARGNWSGLARVESVADSMGQPIGETVGQLENTDTSLIQCDTMDERREIFSLLVSSGGFFPFLQGKSALRKPFAYYVSSNVSRNRSVRVGISHLIQVFI
jgi:hypothetical protein